MGHDRLGAAPGVAEIHNRFTQIDALAAGTGSALHDLGISSPFDREGHKRRHLRKARIVRHDCNRGIHSRFKPACIHLVGCGSCRTDQRVAHVEGDTLHGTVAVLRVGLQGHRRTGFKFRPRCGSRERNIRSLVALAKTLVVFRHFTVAAAHTREIRDFFRESCHGTLFKAVARVERRRIRDTLRHRAVVTVLLLGPAPERDSAKVNVAVVVPLGQIALAVIDIAVLVAHIGLRACAVAVRTCNKESVVIHVLVVQMHLRTVAFARHLRHAAVGIVPVVVRVCQVRIFDKRHVRIGTPAVVFVRAVKIQVADSGVVHEFHVHAVTDPLVADVVCPKLFHVVRCGAHRLEAVAALDQVRVHIVNGEVAVDMVSGPFVATHHDGGSTQVRTAAHAHEALVGLGGNPVAPRLQIVRFLHDFKSGFPEARATVFLEGDAVELVRLARHAVRLAASRTAPGTPGRIRLGHRIAETPEVVCTFGHQNRHSIVTLQVLADARRIARDDDVTCIAARRRSAEAFGLHVECEKQDGRRVSFRAAPDPLGLRIRCKSRKGSPARELVARIVQSRSTAPLAKVAALVFPGVVTHRRFRLPAAAGIVGFVEIINLHKNAGSAGTVHAHDRNRVLAGQESHRNKAHAARLVVFGKERPVMVEPVAAIGHNPDTRPLARIVGSRNQLRPHLVAATVGGIRRQTHYFTYRDSGLRCRNS